jgi:hypothetical protein
MARKKRVTRREAARRSKIRKGLRKYHNDVRAVQAEFGTSWKRSQQLLKGITRRDEKGRRRSRREQLEIVSEREGGIAGAKARIVFAYLLPHLEDAVDRKSKVTIVTSFYTLPPTRLTADKAFEVYHAMQAAGDAFFTPIYEAAGVTPSYWKIWEEFILHKTKKKMRVDWDGEPKVEAPDTDAGAAG